MKYFLILLCLFCSLAFSDQQQIKQGIQVATKHGAVDGVKNNDIGENEKNSSKESSLITDKICSDINEEKGENKSNNPSNICADAYIFPGVKFTDFVLSLSTIAVAIFTGLLWCITRFGIISSHRIETAYVSVTLDFPKKIIWDTKSPNTVKIDVTNHGKTQAYFSKGSAQIFRIINSVIPQKLPSDIAVMEVSHGLAIPPSDRNQPIPLPYIHLVFTEDEIRKIKDWKNPGIGIYGFIEYEDVFKKIRKTGFCWEIVVVLSPDQTGAPIAELAFSYAKSAINEAT